MLQDVLGIEEFTTLPKMTCFQQNKVYMFYDRVYSKNRIRNSAFCLQANFYVEDSSRQGSTQPPPCHLCDGVHDASYQCHKCQRNLCTECRRYHDKLCLGSQVTELQQASSFSCSSMGAEGASHITVKQQLQKVEDVMKKLTEQEKEVNQRKYIVENGIHNRYTTLLRHAGEARDACLTSLTETCQGVSERLQSHMTRAKQAQDTLTQQLSCPQPAPISVPQLNTALFLGGDLQTVLNTDSDREGAVLHHEMKDNTEMLVSCMQSFMGRVVESGQAAASVHSKSSAPELGVLGDRGSSVSAEPSLISAGAGDLQNMQQRLDDLTRQVTMLQTANTQLSQHVTVLSDSSSSKISSVEKELAAVRDKTASDQTTVQRELTALQEKNTKLTADQTAVQREVKTLRNKNAIALQDLSVISSDKDQLRAEVTKLQQDVISMQTDSSMLQTDVIQLKTDHDCVMTHVKTALSDITALQGDVSTAKNDIKKMEAGHATVRSDMTTVQSDVTTLKTDHSSLRSDMTTVQSDVTTLKTDHSSLRLDMTTVQSDVTTLKTDHSSLRSDMTTVQSDVTTLKTDHSSLRSDMTTVQSDVTTLKTDHSSLRSDMTTVQSDVKTLQGDITTAKNDVTTLKTDHSSLRSDVKSAQKHITVLQGDNSTMKSDVKSSKSQLTSLQQSVQSAQDSLRDRTSKITALQTRLSKWLG